MAEYTFADSRGVLWKSTRDGSNRYPWRVTDGDHTLYVAKLADARKDVEGYVFALTKGAPSDG